MFEQRSSHRTAG